MVEENNNLVKSFISLQNIIQVNGFPDDEKLMVHAQEKTVPGNAQKYNFPEVSEVVALVVGEQQEKNRHCSKTSQRILCEWIREARVDQFGASNA